MSARPSARSGPFKVTRGEILHRGLTMRCPNCGAKSLFKPGSLFKTENACNVCGMRWDKDEAAFLGSLVINYGFTVFGVVIPWCLIAISQDLPVRVIAGVAIGAALLIPLVLYRWSKSLWTAFFPYFLPENLPANWRPERDGENPPEE